MKVVLDIDDKFAEIYSEYDLKMYAAVGFYKERLMSTGDLAKIVGINRADFELEMGKYGKSVLDNTIEEYNKDVDNARQFIVQ